MNVTQPDYLSKGNGMEAQKLGVTTEVVLELVPLKNASRPAPPRQISFTPNIIH